MSDPKRGVDAVARRPKRFLSALEKHEIWLHLIRQEVMMAEAAAIVAGRPVHGDADPHGRQGGCAGGAGRVEG